jgi:hypothetical protein
MMEPATTVKFNGQLSSVHVFPWFRPALPHAQNGMIIQLKLYLIVLSENKLLYRLTFAIC